MPPLPTLAVLPSALGTEADGLDGAAAAWAGLVLPLLAGLPGEADALLPLHSAAALAQWALRWRVRAARLADAAVGLDAELTAAADRYLADDAGLVR